jgi:hypothetical protein
MNNHESAEPGTETDNIEHLWNFFMHEDDLLATRVSVFLLAQSILIAVVASLINTVSGLSKASHPALRPELIALCLVLTAAGFGFTLIFWYVFVLNFDNIGVTMDLLREVDPLYVKIATIGAKKRKSRWYFKIIFRRRGMNWIVINGISSGLIILWLAMAGLLVASFLSLKTGRGCWCLRQSATV